MVMVPTATGHGHQINTPTHHDLNYSILTLITTREELEQVEE